MRCDAISSTRLPYHRQPSHRDPIAAYHALRVYPPTAQLRTHCPATSYLVCRSPCRAQQRTSRPLARMHSQTPFGCPAPNSRQRSRSMHRRASTRHVGDADRRGNIQGGFPPGICLHLPRASSRRKRFQICNVNANDRDSNEMPRPEIQPRPAEESLGSTRDPTAGL
jgi:hypothetical protein